MERAPVYQEIQDQMTASIRRGEVRPGEKLGTEVELANRSGISRMSVRKAVEQLIDKGLVERRQGKGIYVRSPSIRTRQIVVVVPDLAFDQCVQIAQGVQQSGSAMGVGVQVYDAQSKLAWDLEMLRKLPETSPDGAIILSWHSKVFAETLYELKRQNYPFVVVDERLRDVDLPTVLADNYGGGYAVGKALTELGHRRIGFIGNFQADTVEQRLSGLRDAISDHGLPFDRSLVLDLDVAPEGDWAGATMERTRQLLSRPDRPTAVFYANDQMAADGYRAIRQMDLKIPQQVSVVGFDGNPLCRWLEPTLASVRQPSSDMGRTALALLMERTRTLRDDPDAAADCRVLATEWLPAASIAPPPDAH